MGVCNMRWRVVPLYLLFCLSTMSKDVGAQSLSRVPGAFVDIGIGARQAAMGYAAVASARGARGMVRNPSSIVSADGFEAAFTYVDQLGLLPYQHFSFVVPLQAARTGIAVSLTESGDDALREFTARIAYARRFGVVSLGLGLAYRRATFGKNDLRLDDLVVFDPQEILIGIGRQVKGVASGVGVDAGVTIRAAEKLIVGVAVRNAFSPVFWRSRTANSTDKTRGMYTESVPLEISFGGAFRPRPWFELAMDITPALDAGLSNRLSVGAEWTIASLIDLRAGYQTLPDGYDNERLTAGFGLHVDDTWGVKVRFDYAFVSDVLANTQQFSLLIGF